MATIRAYTTIKQSRKLAEILPLESADMVYVHTTDLEGDEHYDIDFRNNQPLFEDDIPAWNLAALLDVLPSATLDSSDDHHYRVRCNERFTDWYDNPIDCCVAMINRLHEQMIYDFNNI